MAAPPRVVHKRRATITDLPLYYCGHLLKKHTEEKEYKKYYAELRGATLFLYKDDTQDTYTEKLELEKLKSMELDAPFQKKKPAVFTLTLQTEKVKLKMDNPDTGEEWRGFILTVVTKQIPGKLQLLPGQMMLLQEALDQERARNPPAPSPRPALPPRPSFLRPASPSRSPSRSPSPSPSPSPSAPQPSDQPDHSSSSSSGSIRMPPCFCKVTRQEAERMLEANPEYGGIILRPSTQANNYALTLRQVTSSGPIMRNYRVTSTKNSGFVIELDKPVTVSSLNDVLKYFLEKTEYRLQPYMTSQPYDLHIDTPSAPKCVTISSPSSKTVPKAKVAPMMRWEGTDDPESPPDAAVEGEYVVPDEQQPDYHNLKLVQLDGQLKDILQCPKEAISNRKNTETTYENIISEVNNEII